MKAKSRKIYDILYEDCNTRVCGYLLYRMDGVKIRRKDHIKFPEHIPMSQREKFSIMVVKKNRGIYTY